MESEDKQHGEMEAGDETKKISNLSCAAELDRNMETPQPLVLNSHCADSNQNMLDV